MKVLGINGSPRKNGNTSILINAVFDELKSHGIETELVQLRGPIRGCTACGVCGGKKNKRCIMENDGINEIIEKMEAADGIIIGSPVYFADVTAEMKAFIDRVGMVSASNGGLMKHKVAGAVMAVRRGGATHAFDTMNHFLHHLQTYMVGASYWNMAYGMNPGDVAHDEEGMNNMKVLGENMAWILEKINGGKTENQK